MRYEHAWLIWSLAFLCPWILLYVHSPNLRQEMLRVSGATSLLGLSEPIFVPAYWNPPTLFDLAQRTGFDIESLIFCFAIGGIGAVLYNALSGSRDVAMSRAERHGRRHAFHRLALAVGGVCNVLCRPDLWRGTLIGGALFLGLYAVFMLLLIGSAPGYVEAVWNLPALSGVRIAAVPLEELLFGFSFGLYWSGVYEHVTWRRSALVDLRQASPHAGA